jgi:F-type H+-transporting ATPase subunit b
MKSLQFISIVPWTSIIMVVNVYILYRFLRRFLVKPVRKIFIARETEVAELYENARLAESSAEAAKNEAEKIFESAKNEAEKILERAKKTAIINEEKILNDASVKSEKIIKEAKTFANHIKNKALTESREELELAARKLAEQILGREIDLRAHEKLIDEFLEKFEEEAV